MPAALHFWRSIVRKRENFRLDTLALASREEGHIVAVNEHDFRKIDAYP